MKVWVSHGMHPLGGFTELGLLILGYMRLGYNGGVRFSLLVTSPAVFKHLSDYSFLETVLSGINLHITYVHSTRIYGQDGRVSTTIRYFYLVQHYWDPTYLFVQKPVW